MLTASLTCHSRILEIDGRWDVANRFEANPTCFIDDGEEHVFFEAAVDLHLIQAGRPRVYRVGYRGGALATRGWLLGERPLPGHQVEAKYYFAWGLDHLDPGGAPRVGPLPLDCGAFLPGCEG